MSDLTLSGTMPGQPVTDAATIQPFASVSVASTATSTLYTTASVALSSTADGALSDLGIGTLSADGSAYRVSGSPTDVQAALQGLMFTPTAHQVPVGQSVTTGFSLTASDASGTVTDVHTSVVATAADTLPTVTDTSAMQTPTSSIPPNLNGGTSPGMTSFMPFAYTTITDPDAGAAETTTLTLTQNGAATDAVGTLSGSGLTKTGVGTYALAAAAPAGETAALQALRFTPIDPYAAETLTVTFQVADGVGVPATVASSIGLSGNPGGETVISNSSTSTTTYNDTPANNATHSYATVIDGVLSNGAVVYDHSFSLPYSDPQVQAAVAQAEAAVQNAGQTPGSPTQTASNLAILSSQTAATQTGESTSPSVITSSATFGPAFFGPNTNVNVAADRGFLGVESGQLDININTATTTTIDRTVTTTSTDLLSQQYVITGTSAASPTAGAPAASGAIATIPYTFGAPAVTLEPNIALTDTDGQQLTGLVVAFDARRGGDDITARDGAGAAVDLGTVDPNTQRTTSVHTVGRFTETTTIDASDIYLQFSGPSSLTTADYQALLRTLTYSSADDGDLPGTEGVRIVLSDSTHPVPASTYVEDGVNGYSDASTVIALSLPAPTNTPPTISGTQAGQADVAGVAISPFSTVTVTDPDAGQTETVTVALSAAANGTLAGGGFVQSAAGVYSVTAASAAAAQADLRAAIFTPVAGQSSTTGFTLTVSDGQAAATDGATSVVATYTPPPPPASSGGGTVTTTSPSVQYGLTTEFQNLERALAGGADALTPTTPVYAAFQAEKLVAAQLDAGQITLAQAEGQLAHLVDGTTAVAVASYGFFTGSTPTAAGLNYLVHSQANATDLNDAYYARFSTENRYINFAVNLATGPGAGASSFAASYGSLSLADATAKAYAAVFGAPADATKVSALLDTLVPDGLGGQETRAAYFAQYGGDGPNGQGTKAAMVGFLLANAVETGAGVYGAATEHYLSALAHGQAPAFGSELALTYGANVNLVGFTPVPDPTVTT